MSEPLQCRDCGLTKPTTDFTPHPKYATGYHPRCKPCNAAHMRRWREQNYDHFMTVNRSYVRRNKDRVLETNRRSRAKIRAERQAGAANAVIQNDFRNIRESA